MAELVVGAGFRALAGELLKVVVNAIRFKPVFDEIKKTLDTIIPVLKEIEDLNQSLGKSAEEMQKLTDLINEGKQILVHCSTGDDRWWNIFHYLKRPSYTKKLQELDSALKDFQIVLVLQIFRDQKTNTVMLKQILDILNRPQITDQKCGVRKGISKMVKRVIDFGSLVANLSSEMELSDSLGYEGYSNEGNKLVLRCYELEQSKVKALLLSTKKIQNLEQSIHTFPEISLHLTFYHHQKKRKGNLGPNFIDAQPGRLVEYKNDGKKAGKTSGCVVEEMIKKLEEARYKKKFHRRFETVADEKLQNWFCCDLLTQVNGRLPLVGILYVSTAKLAFCSHGHIPPGHKKKLYLKAVIQLELLKAVGISSSVEKCIQVISIDNQEFRFTKFEKFNDANQCLKNVSCSRRCGHFL